MITLVTPAIPPIIDLNVTLVVGQSSDEMPRKLPQSIPMTNVFGTRKLVDGMPLPTPPTDDLEYTQFMENIIFKGNGHAFHIKGQGISFDQGNAFNPEETQSQDSRSQYGADDFDAHEEKEADHGNSWHDDEDIYCEDEEEEVGMVEEPLIFIDELTQIVEAQRRGEIIHMESYKKDEDTLICES
ncbi:putative MO25-like protein [Hordeum vulgare]|nr:putative MO25-like protein [Hordeum vulgare]